MITAHFRDQHNNLTFFFTGDCFVFVMGKMAQVLHHSALIDYAKCLVWHKSQELACRRCRHIGRLSTNLKACDAYLEDQTIITVRSPNCVMSNYFTTIPKYLTKNSNQVSMPTNGDSSNTLEWMTWQNRLLTPKLLQMPKQSLQEFPGSSTKIGIV